MRKVTKETVKAFLNRKSRKIGNTETDGSTLRLHGNRIAWHTPDGRIETTLAGWGTVTTRDRLNGLCVMLGLCNMFGQSKWEQYYGDNRIATNATIEVAAAGWTYNPPSYLNMT